MEVLGTRPTQRHPRKSHLAGHFQNTEIGWTLDLGCHCVCVPRADHEAKVHLSNNAQGLSRYLYICTCICTCICYTPNTSPELHSWLLVCKEVNGAECLLCSPEQETRCKARVRRAKDRSVPPRTDKNILLRPL